MTNELDILRNVLGGIEFFKASNDKQIYAKVKTVKGCKTLPIKSDEFGFEVKGKYFEIVGKLPPKIRFEEAIEEVTVKVSQQHELTEMHLRVARHDDAVYVDLSNEGKAVEITAHDWRVVGQAPVIFKTPCTAKSLPEPQKGGDISLLRKYVNINDWDFILLVAYLLGSFRPRGPYPILVLEGQQGSAKSTLSRIVKDIVDPSLAPLRSLYTDEKEMLIALQNSHLLVMDNLSGMPAKISDIVCRVSTGGAISSRTLYTNADEFVLDAMRPLVLNGIDSIAKRGDLASRSIVLELPKIDKDKRKTEEEIFSEFYQDLPHILGAIMDGISCAFRNRDQKPIIEGRLADFEAWVQAGIEGLGLSKEEFIEAYRANMKQVTLSNANENPVVQAILGILRTESINSVTKGKNSVEWKGTATTLMNKARECYSDYKDGSHERYKNTRSISWAAWQGIKELSNPAAFGKAINRAESELAELGITIVKNRKKTGVEYVIKSSLDALIDMKFKGGVGV
ncbi:hypothetical protein [Paenibacillus alkalitolerans]|uniref:hypothetical protein n=1 Tax=Paenibacillus alkalitolerans TaxID=2799335 RepID=UPI0018F683D1|nr:hypothetical protein [Paenibacillus alkalitolerans]